MLKRLISVTEGGFVSLGKKIDENFEILGGKIDGFRNETNQNFQRMDEKYRKLSEAMFTLIDRIEKRQQSFEEHIERIDKNIETLLEILAKERKW